MLRDDQDLPPETCESKLSQTPACLVLYDSSESGFLETNLESSLRLVRNTLPELRSTQLARVAGSSDWEDAGREIRSGV